MKKLAFLLLVLSILNPATCNKKGSSSPSPVTGNQWSQWVSISSYPLKARYRKGDDLGGGNFGWDVQILNDGIGFFLRFSYRIEVQKGDGSADVIEGTAKIAPGATDSIKLSAARITRVIASDVQQLAK